MILSHFNEYDLHCFLVLKLIESYNLQDMRITFQLFQYAIMICSEV